MSALPCIPSGVRSYGRLDPYLSGLYKKENAEYRNKNREIRMQALPMPSSIQKERTITLNNIGSAHVKRFLHSAPPLPSTQGWGQNLKEHMIKQDNLLQGYARQIEIHLKVMNKIDRKAMLKYVGGWKW